MILLAIYIVLCLLAVVFPRSKRIMLLVVYFLTFAYAFTWTSGDLEIYEWVYNSLLSGDFNRAYEPGFIGLMWLCRLAGLPFSGFRLVAGAIIVIVAARVIQRQTAYCALVMALYGIFPFFQFVSVIRSGVACSFVLLAVEQLFDEPQNKKKYIGLIVCAVLFHYSSLLFLPFLVFTRMKRKHLSIAFIGMCVLTFLTIYTDVIYRIVSKITQRQKILIWLSTSDGTANLKGILAIVILLLSLYYLGARAYRKSKGTAALEKLLLGGARCNQGQVMYQISLYMIFLFPFMALASPIMRIPYMVFLMFAIVSINDGEGRIFRTGKNVGLGSVGIKPAWVLMLSIALLWKIYADLPYLKTGAHLFPQLTDAVLYW